MASATAIEADGSWLKAAHNKRRVSGSERAEVRVHTTALCSPTRQALLTEWYPAIYDGTTPMEQSKSPEEGYHFHGGVRRRRPTGYFSEGKSSLENPGSFADGRATYSAGAFNDWFVNDRSMSANGNQYTGRFQFLPVDPNADHTVASVAAGVYYKEKIDGTLQYRSRPEANQFRYFVDTDKFAANHSTTTQFEVMAMSGPTQVFGELMLTPVNAPTEFNYGYGVLDRGRTQGHFDVFQGRAQFGF